MSSARFAALHLLALGPAAALPVNLAPQGVATGSSEAYGSVFKDAADGIRDGNFYSANGSVWHTTIPDTAAFYEVDLGSTQVLDRVMIWPRTDAVQGTVRNFTIKLLSAAGATVWSGDFFAVGSASQPWGTSALRGLAGRRVRIEKKDATPNFLTFAEFEVWGSPQASAVNLARLPGTSATASNAASGTTAAVVIDGQLNGDYGTTASPRPVYISADTTGGAYWQLDLGAAKEIDAVTLYNRTDASGTTTVKVAFLDAAQAEVHSTVLNISRDVLVNQGRQFDVTYDVPGTVTARYVKITPTVPTVLALAEVEVFAPVADTIAPTIVQRDPEAGALLAELTRVEMDFSEDMTGLDPTDLLVNGTPATGLTLPDGSHAMFSFAQPASGPVTLSFAAGHGISDGAGNALVTSPWSVTLDTSLPAPQPVITEILADNKGGLRDEDGDSPDWIEIYNPGPTAVNLGGWFLSDAPLALTKWAFPSPTVLQAGESLVIFASSKNRAVAGHELHTNFKLDPDGESVLLVKPDGTTVASSILNYPPQRTNVSYGRGASFSSAPLLAVGAPGKFRVPSGDIAGWTARDFDDSAWTSVTTGVGFDVSAGLGAGGPLGWWAFNDAGNAAVATDSSGNARSGTVVNATYTADALGRSGQPGDRAMNFAGNGAVWIPAAASGAFDAITQRNALTVSLWIYGAADMPKDNFAFFGASDTGFGSRVIDAHLPWSDSVIYWDTAGCCDPGQTRVFVGEPNPAMWRGQWNHYAFVKNRDLKEIWQNGFLLLASVNTAPMVNMRSFVIGAMNSAGTTGYRGRIDDFVLWDGALGEAQIKALAAGGSPADVRKLTPLVATDVAPAMRNVSAGAYLRVPFTVANAAEIDLLSLDVRYDDGFVAYLNGTEVARRNAPASVTFSSAAAAERPSGSGLVAETLDLSRFASLLREGANVLAFHALNASATDGDFLLQPALRAGRSLQGRYFTALTPGEPNGEGFTGFVSDVKFFPQRGFHDAPTTVTLTCATPGATIVWTTDGSTPSLTNGTAGASPQSVNVATTTTLRAAAFSGTLSPANVDTHTYLFVDHVATQQRPPTSPATWGGGAADFAMDSRVPAAGSPHTLRSALLDLPTLSLTTDPAGLWSAATGIYANPQGRGRSWERATSVEWMEPGAGDGHATGGLRIHGNISRDKGFTPKHGFSLRFRSEYGDSQFKHAIFPDTAVDSFDELVLRAGSTDTWPCTEWGTVGLGLNGEAYQRWNRDWASYVRDQWVRDAHLAMGHEDFRGRFCHLYLNGSYWGVYNVTESPHASFMAAHLGHDEDAWDTVADFSELHEGSRAAWDQLLGMADGGQLDTDAGLRRVQGLNPDGTPNPAYPKLLEVDSLIDYMILHVTIGADDWPDHNWWGARPSRATTPEGFRFFAWDQEISNENTLYGKSSWGVVYAEANAGGTPTRVYSRLRNSPEFRMRFADRVHKHHFAGGALTQQANVARWQRRVAEVDKALVAESARWGDSQANHTNAGQPYTRENAWLPHLTWMATNYWPQLPAVALQRFRSANLYPSVSAPVFSRSAGVVPPGSSVTLTNANAAGTTLVWTLDGSDPRLWGGAQNPAASAATASTAQATVNAPLTLKARVKSGTTWSALMEATFIPDPDLDDDGLPDDWEAQNGLSSADPTDATRDSDGDGRTNFEEWAAGTNPRDAASVLDRQIAFSGNSGAFTLEFPLVAGRAYAIERSDTLENASWTVRAEFPAETTSRPATWSETPAAGRHFYRLVITPPAVAR